MAETKPALEVLRELRASLCNPNLICRGCGQQYLRCACVIVLDDAEADEKAGAALQQAVAADQPVAKALALALLAAGQQPFAGAAAATQEPEAVPATAAMQQQQQVQGTGSQESEVTHTAAEEDLQLDFADDAGGFEGHTADQALLQTRRTRQCSPQMGSSSWLLQQPTRRHWREVQLSHPNAAPSGSRPLAMAGRQSARRLVKWRRCMQRARLLQGVRQRAGRLRRRTGIKRTRRTVTGSA